MADPFEGVAADGTIRTGARRDRVPQAFEPVIRAAVAAGETGGGSLYLYGSVANGTARPGTSDVDLLSIDLPRATDVAAGLSRSFADLCRGVEIAAAHRSDLDGVTDEAYGNRAFLRHYCIHLAGPDHAAGLPAFPADARAARGFNGDLGRHLHHWRAELRSGATPPGVLGVRIARKTLLAVAGLVSVHDGGWTTDRALSAQRYGEIEPGLRTGLAELASWVTGSQRPDGPDVDRVLAVSGLVPTIVTDFEDLIGLWPEGAG